MNIYIYETNTSGTSKNIIESQRTTNFQPFTPIVPTDTLRNPTFQIITTSEVSGIVQTTLNGTDFIDTFSFTSTSADTSTLVYDGLMTDFRVRVSSISGNLKMIVGV